MKLLAHEAWRQYAIRFLEAQGMVNGANFHIPSAVTSHPESIVQGMDDEAWAKAGLAVESFM